MRQLRIKNWPIEFYSKHPEFYYIQLQNKHQLVVPVNQYIAEYAPDEEGK